MKVEELVQLFDRDLGKLQREIEAFTDEKNLWQTEGNLKNSAGNLCLHLIGNLSTYIGKNLGGMVYVRNREAEFASKDIPRKELIEQVSSVRQTVMAALQTLGPDDVSQRYPENVLGFDMTTGFFLMHLLAHLSYHLGQINYLRRVLE